MAQQNWEMDVSFLLLVYVGIKLYIFNILVQNPMAAKPDTSPENELASDHRHSTNGSTELRVSTDDDNKLAAVTCSPSETIHRSTETGWFIQLFCMCDVLFIFYCY